MSHIFISYSHKDKKYVEKLEKKLIEEGFNVWIDHRIDYGSQWTAEIEKAIDTCDAYIVVMSEDAKKSPWVQREIIQAEKKKKPFFPLLLEGDVWFSLGNIQYVDVSKYLLPPSSFYKHLNKVVPREKKKELVQTLANTSRRSSKTVPKEKRKQLTIVSKILENSILLITSFLISTALVGGSSYVLFTYSPEMHALELELVKINAKNKDCETFGKYLQLIGESKVLDVNQLQQESSLFEILPPLPDGEFIPENKEFVLNFIDESIENLIYERGTFEGYSFLDNSLNLYHIKLLDLYDVNILSLEEIRSLAISWDNETPEQRQKRADRIYSVAVQRKGAFNAMQSAFEQTETYWETQYEQTNVELKTIKSKIDITYLKFILSILGIILGLAMMVFLLFSLFVKVSHKK